MSTLRSTRQTLLISDGDPAPVSTINADSKAPVALVCEHAGQAIPARLGNMGLASGDIDKHVGWDIGAGAVTRTLAEHLSAPAVFQPYSRLVIDCNRPPKAPDSAPAISHGVAVPANVDLSAIDHWIRVAEIFLPFQQAVDSILDGRSLALSIHSFEPDLGDGVRPWDIGLLHRKDQRTSALLKAAIERRAPSLAIGMNEPYTIDDESDFFVPWHGEARNIGHVLIEIRNDHLLTAEGCRRWADLLRDCTNDILPEFSS